MRIETLPASDAVLTAIGRKADLYLNQFDSPAELARYARDNSNPKAQKYFLDQQRKSWSGNETTDSACAKAESGDLSLVSNSDRLLDRLEKYSFETQRTFWLNDVAGALPNVQAHIAGHPLTMRRRSRDASASAPIAIIVDLTTSAGIEPLLIETRGAAILSLVRLLTSRRPVELWAGAMLGAGTREANAALMFAKIDTTPLDLSTAAFTLTSPAFPRMLCYSIGFGHGSTGAWPFNAIEYARTHTKDIVAPAFTHVTETLCIPPLNIHDDFSDGGESWVKSQLDIIYPERISA